MREGAASVRTGRAAPSVRLAQLTVTTYVFNTADNAVQSYRAGWLTRVHYGSATSDSYNERDYRCSVLRLTRLSGIDSRTAVDLGARIATPTSQEPALTWLRCLFDARAATSRVSKASSDCVTLVLTLASLVSTSASIDCTASSTSLALVSCLCSGTHSQSAMSSIDDRTDSTAVCLYPQCSCGDKLAPFKATRLLKNLALRQSRSFAVTSDETDEVSDVGGV